MVDNLSREQATDCLDPDTKIGNGMIEDLHSNLREANVLGVLQTVQMNTGDVLAAVAVVDLPENVHTNVDGVIEAEENWENILPLQGGGLALIRGASPVRLLAIGLQMWPQRDAIAFQDLNSFRWE
jgi:hypothetical protein